MSNVVISNRSIFNQKVSKIEQGKVLLPFNVNKEQINKLKELLSKIKVTFLSEQDNLKIKELEYNNKKIKTNDKELNNCKFTLAKTYVVTMKQTFISKVKPFYDNIIKQQEPSRPVFNIGNETNLQQALAEATTEIDLKEINNALNIQTSTEIKTEEQTPQVLANNPLGETVIEKPVNLTPASTEVEKIETPSVNNQENIVSTTPQEPQVTPTEIQTNAVAEQNPAVANANVVQPTQVVEQPKVKVKKLKGSVLAVPIVVVWLGAVFYGTLKLVTSILT